MALSYFQLKQERLADLYPIPGAIVAVARLVRAGFVCPVITVQSRIAKGLFTAAEFRDWFRGFAVTASQQGAELKGPYVCPHRYAEPCDCKKPKSPPPSKTKPASSRRRSWKPLTGFSCNNYASY